jgi:hypothetical protein
MNNCVALLRQKSLIVLTVNFLKLKILLSIFREIVYGRNELIKPQTSRLFEVCYFRTNLKLTSK